MASHLTYYKYNDWSIIGSFGVQNARVNGYSNTAKRLVIRAFKDSANVT